MIHVQAEDVPKEVEIRKKRKHSLVEGGKKTAAEVSKQAEKSKKRKHNVAEEPKQKAEEEVPKDESHVEEHVVYEV